MFGQGKTPDELLRAARLRRRLSLAASILILAAALILLVVYHPLSLISQKENQNQTASMNAGSSNAQNGTGQTTGLTASGTTARASVSQILNFAPESYKLDVQDLKVAVGDTISVGDPLLELTAASVEKTRADLQREVSFAQTAFNQAALDYQDQLVSLKATLSGTQAQDSIARQDYTLALSELKQAVETAQTAMDKAHDQIASHPARIATAKKELASFNDRLDDAEEDLDDSQSKLNAAAKARDQAELAAAGNQAILDFLAEHQDDLDADLYADLCGTARDRLSQAKAAADSAAADVNAANAAVREDQAKVADLKDTVNQYESLIDKLETELDTATKNVAALELKYHQADLDLLTGQIQQEEALKLSLVDVQYAKTVYSQSLSEAKAAYETARLTLDDANARLKAFEAELGKGVILSRYAGKVISLGYEAGDRLTATTAVLELQDASRITITVNMDQSAISRLKVGDAVQAAIQTQGQPVYAGTITRINPTPSSRSMSNVTYAVEITLDETASGLEPDLSATVQFQTAHS
jgi:multidrug resistance efflux pump